MLPFKKITCFLFLLWFLGACNTATDTKSEMPSPNKRIDSCEIALKFPGANTAETGVSKNYTGEIKKYFSDDKTKIELKHIFENGSLVKSLFYYANQKIQAEFSFKCGAYHGVQKWYHENGNLKKIIPYSYGYKNGTGFVYDAANHLMRKALFRNDSILKNDNYDVSGKITDSSLSK
jgi:antitoxin component YwqK of YwqJK toxin-antitoxin module